MSTWVDGYMVIKELTHYLQYFLNAYKVIFLIIHLSVFTITKSHALLIRIVALLNYELSKKLDSNFVN